MRITLVLTLIILGACARNDPELVNRVSAKAASDDALAAAVGFSKGLQQSDIFLAVRLCTIHITLALSANATRDGHLGLAVTVPAPGATVGGNASGNSSATDQRANTIDMLYRSIDTQTCPPQEAVQVKSDATPASTDPKSGATNASSSSAATNTIIPKKTVNTTSNQPQNNSNFFRDHIAGTCLDPNFLQTHPAPAGMTNTDWLRRVCPVGVISKDSTGGALSPSSPDRMVPR